jgi:hypothetical protein
MSRREKKNINNYPNYVDKYREVTSVLRDNEGYMVFSEIIDKKVFYRKTNVKDINISPNETGRRRFRRNIHLSILKKNIIEENYQGELFMYCLHSLKQDLLLVSEFSFNKSYPHLIVNEYGQSIQPFCKESKKIFVNENSNKKRTSDQHVEGSQGSRTRGLVTALCYGENVPTGEELFKKFGGRCAYTGKILDINDRGSWQKDHFMPASAYNPLSDKNTVLTSKDANQSKNDKHPMQFLGCEKYEEVCHLLGIDPKIYDDVNYTLNDYVLYYFNDNFDDIIYKWHFEINRNKISFKKYLSSEISRLIKKDIYGRHKELINKMKRYEEKV